MVKLATWCHLEQILYSTWVVVPQYLCVRILPIHVSSPSQQDDRRGCDKKNQLLTRLCFSSGIPHGAV